MLGLLGLPVLPRLPDTVQVQPAQGAGQSAQSNGVGLTEGAGQEFAGRVVVQLLRAQAVADEGEHGTDDGLGRHGQVVGAHGHRDRGGGERSAQHGQLSARGAHQDRHVRPRDPVDQVGTPQ